MGKHLSIKNRLTMLSVFAVLTVLVLIGVIVSANRFSASTLEEVVEQNTDTLVRMQQLENTLLEVRFRAAGVLLEQVSVQGSLNHLRESEAHLKEL